MISPGLVRTDMTEVFGDDLPWTPPELAPRLVRVLASGRADRLAGRYIHAEHDDIDAMIERADEIEERDLNAIRREAVVRPARWACFNRRTRERRWSYCITCLSGRWRCGAARRPPALAAA